MPSKTSQQKTMSNAGLLDTLHVRQNKLMSHMLKFLSVTSIVALIGFVVTSIIQWVTGTMPVHSSVSFPSNPTLGALIALFLTLVSIWVMWIFALWSVALIPYITVQAYRAASDFDVPPGTKALRWAQLWVSSTLLPMTIFALVWSSIANPKAVAKLSIQSAEDMIIVVLGALIVIGVLWCINLIPSKYVTTHISLLSSLLYTALFLTYGRGFGLVSNSMLLGVLIYLTFGLGKFAGLALRVVIYDIDPQIADELEELQKHTQEAKLQRETTGIREQALKAKSESLEERGRSSQIQVDEFLLDTLHT
jgi:hypothetical protein